jgi:hypothetical protein
LPSKRKGEAILERLEAHVASGVECFNVPAQAKVFVDNVTVVVDCPPLVDVRLKPLS